MTTRRQWMHRVKPSRDRRDLAALFEEADRVVRLNQVDLAEEAIERLAVYLPVTKAALYRVLDYAIAQHKEGSNLDPALPVHLLSGEIERLSPSVARRHQALVSLRIAFKEGKYKRL